MTTGTVFQVKIHAVYDISMVYTEIVNVNGQKFL